MDEMNTTAVSSVPYIAFEAAQARAERITKRLVLALVIAIALIFASNAAWLWAWMQYDYVSETVTTETVTVDGSDGAANYASNGGSIINGTYYGSEDQEARAVTIQKGGVKARARRSDCGPGAFRGCFC